MKVLCIVTIYKHNLYYIYIFGLLAPVFTISAAFAGKIVYILWFTGWKKLTSLTPHNCVCVCVKIYCFVTVNCVALNVKNAHSATVCLFVWQSKSYWHQRKLRTLHNAILYCCLQDKYLHGWWKIRKALRKENKKKQFCNSTLMFSFRSKVWKMKTNLMLWYTNDTSCFLFKKILAFILMWKITGYFPHQNVETTTTNIKRQIIFITFHRAWFENYIL